jgi:predicted RNase H-like nuclease (RuvC/YqgF family)
MKDDAGPTFSWNAHERRRKHVENLRQLISELDSKCEELQSKAEQFAKSIQYYKYHTEPVLLNMIKNAR